jgi:hypothetical protein
VHSDAPVAYANTSVNAGLACDETIHVYIVGQLTAAVPASTVDFSHVLLLFPTKQNIVKIT